MKDKTKITIFFLIIVVLFQSLSYETAAFAEPSTVDGEGKIGFSGKYEQTILDPENPTIEVDPGESPKTDGSLRIDFVPTLNFYKNKISDQGRTYYANAQNFFSDISARGNFIQVTDRRTEPKGWTLQLKQENQFVNTTENSELKGSFLSFDKSWANSAEQSAAPQISKDAIILDNLNTSYDLAKAAKDEGIGTWAIVFGASAENTSNQLATLEPRIDEKQQTVVDTEVQNKPLYLNKAVSLHIPEATQIVSGDYSTVLTWILAELP
ncbi:WxL domain-containing protein [Candidatus Enterococcus mansonii]|uniref:WxL domain-containing protein n=1 Tax=Candidatus Enterococcus mansonii TaxID=1834181 RepID=A0A242CD73_9ENTE|nr:WxL domain-containing protein [Enterococcus sp. 4G2_DIV0659]OTO08156.1 hypothetical protein A5880_002426 [Enterococcus sp. 4G2_DIV0659]